MALPVFSPIFGGTIALSATTTSSNSTVNSNASVLKITNVGTDRVFIKIGTGTQTATTTDLPVISGETVYVNPPRGANNIAAIAASTTATVLVCPAYGNAN